MELKTNIKNVPLLALAMDKDNAAAHTPVARFLALYTVASNDGNIAVLIDGHRSHVNVVIGPL